MISNAVDQSMPGHFLLSVVLVQNITLTSLSSLSSYDQLQDWVEKYTFILVDQTKWDYSRYKWLQDACLIPVNFESNIL